ncbi:MAG: T9SS type A sorting domain-containing protein [Chitinophagaceae bacterium]|nr:T9SS type A sorting domain-containing protein [Chitinophagaceae bacterium]
MKSLFRMKQFTFTILLSWTTMSLSAQVAELVKYISPGTESLTPHFLANLNGTILISANDPNNGKELWKTDGTTAGTVLVKDINHGSPGSSPYFIADLNGVVLIGATDPVNGTELWKTDGTTAGTVLVKDIYAGATGSDPVIISKLNGIVIFKAKDAFHQTELWKTDGTTAGTVLVKDINTAFFGGSSNPYLIGSVNGLLLLSATSSGNGTELWKTDGTTGGTVLLRDIFTGTSSADPAFLKDLNGTILFSATDAVNGTELWKTDGTSAGTVLVKDINPGTANSSPAFLTSLNGTQLLRATSAVTGTELWKTDGTSAGTVLVKDINPGAATGFPYFLATRNGFVYFNANDQVHGYELWRTDGTTAGTLLFADIEEGVGSSNVAFMGELKGSLIFSATPSYPGSEPYVIDTNEVLSLLKDINPGPGGSYPYCIASINDVMFFETYEYSNGGSLWKTNGTTAGTELVTGNDPFFSAYSFDLITYLNGAVLISGSDPINGNELWKIPAPFTIDATATVNGSINPAGNVLAYGGAAPTFTIYPQSGFCISDVLVDGISQGPLSTFTFSNVAANHSIKAEFSPAPVFYADTDNDGFGFLLNSVTACSAPTGFVSDNTDCNDANSLINPNATDICNTVDDNCNGQVDENNPVAVISPTGIVEVCKGTDVIFTATAGIGISYQWKKDGANINNATAATYTTGVKGDYSVTMSNAFNCSSTSATSTLKTLSKPDAIITPLSNLDICATGSVVLQANAGTNLSYQWKKNGSKINGATNQNFTATTAAGYKVVVTKNNGCTKTSPQVTVTKSCKLSGEKQSTDGISIYPNPSNGKFTVRFTNDENETATIEVLNALGQQMLFEKTTSGYGQFPKEITFNNQTPDGIYFVRLTTTQRTYTTQVILQQ